MVSNATGAKNDLKYENLSMSLISLLEWIPDSNWFQKVVQFKVFPSNGEVTNFGNLQLISSTEVGHSQKKKNPKPFFFLQLWVGGVEDLGENMKLFHRWLF